MHLKSDMGEIEVYLCPDEKTKQKFDGEIKNESKNEEQPPSISSQTMVYAQPSTSSSDPVVSIVHVRLTGF